MPAMSSVHVIDKDTPADLLRQLALLRRAPEPVVCVGAPPAHLPSGLAMTHLRPAFDVGAWADRWLGFPPLEAQVVHAWSLGARQVGRRLARDLGCVLVVSLDGAAPSAKAPQACCPMAARANVPTVYLAPNESHARAWQAAGISPAAMELLPAPAGEITDAAERRTRTRAALNVADDETVLLEPEDMVRGAGQKHAIWCHAILRQILPAARLVLPGHGPYESSIRYFSGTTGYGSETVFIGEQFPLEDLLAAADVTLFLGDLDSSPAAFAAAMAGGCAIVASRTPAQSYLLEHESSALLTPLRDPRRMAAAVLRMCDSAELRARMGAGAKARGAATSAQARARLEQIYGAAIGRCREATVRG